MDDTGQPGSDPTWVNANGTARGRAVGQPSGPSGATGSGDSVEPNGAGHDSSGSPAPWYSPAAQRSWTPAESSWAPQTPAEPRPADPGRTAHAAESSWPAQPAEPGWPSQPAEPRRPSQPAGSSWPSQPAGSSWPAQPAESSWPSQPAGSRWPAQQAEPGWTAQAAWDAESWNADPHRPAGAHPPVEPNRPPGYDRAVESNQDQTPPVWSGAPPGPAAARAGTPTDRTGPPTGTGPTTGTGPLTRGSFTARSPPARTSTGGSSRLGRQPPSGPPARAGRTARATATNLSSCHRRGSTASTPPPIRSPYLRCSSRSLPTGTRAATTRTRRGRSSSPPTAPADPYPARPPLADERLGGRAFGHPATEYQPPPSNHGRDGPGTTTAAPAQRPAGRPTRMTGSGARWTHAMASSPIPRDGQFADPRAASSDPRGGQSPIRAAASSPIRAAETAVPWSRTAETGAPPIRVTGTVLLWIRMRERAALLSGRVDGNGRIPGPREGNDRLTAPAGNGREGHGHGMPMRRPAGWTAGATNVPINPGWSTQPATAGGFRAADERVAARAESTWLPTQPGGPRVESVWSDGARGESARAAAVSAEAARPGSARPDGGRLDGVPADCDGAPGNGAQARNAVSAGIRGDDERLDPRAAEDGPQRPGTALAASGSAR